MFSLICAWINGSVNNREAGDLRRHGAHYDVIVMIRKSVRNSSHFIALSDNFNLRHPIILIFFTKHESITSCSVRVLKWLSGIEKNWGYIKRFSWFVICLTHWSYCSLGLSLRYAHVASEYEFSYVAPGGWRLGCQPIKSHAWMFFLIKMYCNMKCLIIQAPPICFAISLQLVNVKYSFRYFLAHTHVLWYIMCYIVTVTSKRARWRPKSPVPRLFTQTFIQAHIKENIKAPCHWPLWGEFTDDRWIPLTKGQWRGKCFNLMTSS